MGRILSVASEYSPVSLNRVGGGSSSKDSAGYEKVIVLKGRNIRQKAAVYIPLYSS